MDKVEVSIPNGDKKYIERAAQSCKDVLFGVPKFDSQVPDYSVLVSVKNRTKVYSGNNFSATSISSIPPGDYLFKSVGYKYVTIVYKSRRCKIDGSEINKVSVLTDSKDDDDE